MNKTEEHVQRLPAYKRSFLQKYIEMSKKLQDYRERLKMTPEERKAAIEKAQKDARASMALAKELRTHCEHRIRKSNLYESAQCDVCGTYFGWYCPVSPDSVCHYETNDELMIELIDGNLSKPGSHWAGKKHENKDCCVFCGDPEERK